MRVCVYVYIHIYNMSFYKFEEVVFYILLLVSVNLKWAISWLYIWLIVLFFNCSMFVFVYMTLSNCWFDLYATQMQANGKKAYHEKKILIFRLSDAIYLNVSRSVISKWLLLPSEATYITRKITSLKRESKGQAKIYNNSTTP